MNKRDSTELPPLSRVWAGLYVFGAFWILLNASLDASHFGPGFFPLMISLVVVPIVALVFAGDFVIRLVEAIQGTRSSALRRWGPVVVALTGTVVYGGASLLFLFNRT